MPPVIHLKVADTKVSLWILLLGGLATGYLAGTIGVGGFIGVPAMIYVFGVPTAVAAGTELYLAMFMGAFGALNYAWEGYVDIRLVLLLYLGSLLGIHLGTYGVKVVSEKIIRLVTAIIILLCVMSRAIAIPMYLRQIHVLAMDAEWDVYFNGASKVLLFLSGIAGCATILYYVSAPTCSARKCNAPSPSRRTRAQRVTPSTPKALRSQQLGDDERILEGERIEHGKPTSTPHSR